PTLGQRVGKWARRHRQFVRAAVVLVLLALVLLAASNAVVWQSRQQLKEEVRLRGIREREATAALGRANDREARLRNTSESILKTLDQTPAEADHLRSPHDPEAVRSGRAIEGAAVSYYRDCLREEHGPGLYLPDKERFWAYLLMGNHAARRGQFPD